MASSLLGVLLYAGVFAFWGYEWDITDTLLYILAVPTGKDFINLYAAGQIVSDGLSLDTLSKSNQFAIYLTDLLNTKVPEYHYVWSYPPTALLLARLFSWLPYFPAFGLWSVGTMAVYSGGLYLAGLRGWWLLAGLLAPAAAVNLFFGQYGFLLAGLLLGGLFQVDRRPVLAGVLLGLATIKPQLGLLLPILLLAQRQWRVIAVAALVALLLVALSLFLDGVEVWRQYFDLVLPVQRKFLEAFIGFFMLLTLTPFMALKIVGLPVPALYAGQIAVTLLCAVAVYRVGRRGAHQPAIIFTLAAGFLATPYAMAYDLVIMAGAGLVLLASRPDWLRTGPRAIGFILLWILPLWGLGRNLYFMPVVPFVIALFAWQVYVEAFKKSKSAPSSACVT